MDAGQPSASVLQRVEGGAGHIFTQTGDVYVVQLPAAPEQSDARALRSLRETARRQWVDTGFSRILVERSPWVLEKVESQRSVERPWGLVGMEADRPDRPLPRDSRMSDIFEGFGRQALILGEPGAGKTFTLLELAKDLLDVADADPGAPVPVVFLLSGWARLHRPFREWLIAELVDKYQLPQATAARWLDEHRFILLLDGLDEMKPELQAKCVEAINEFCRDHASAGLAVCSRVADYENLPLKLRIGAAVRIQPLADADVEAYLARGGASLANLREALDTSTAVKELLRVPLMLTLATQAYRDAEGKGLKEEIAEAGQSAHRVILRDYVERMLRIRDHRPYSRERILAWLHWLARHARLGLFRSDALDPAWLPKSLDRLHALVFLCFQIATSSFLVAVVVVFIGRVQGGLPVSDLQWHDLYSLAGSLSELLIVSMLAGIGLQVAIRTAVGQQRLSPGHRPLEMLLYAVLVVPLFAIGYSRVGDPTLLGLSTWAGAVSSVTHGGGTFFNPHRTGYWQGLGKRGLWMAIASVAIWTPISMVLAASSLATTAMGGWLFHLIAATVWVFLVSLMFRSPPWGMLLLPLMIVGTAAVVDLRRYGGSEALASRHFGLATLPATAVVLVGAIEAASSSISWCLAYAREWLGRKLLRLLLYWSGRAPWRYDDFVVIATQMGFMKREGGGHVFLHRYLQEYFDGLDDEDPAKTAA